MFRSPVLQRFLASLAIVALASFTSRAVFAEGHLRTPNAAGFPDTEKTDYAEAFAYLRNEGIVSGYSDGLGRPGSPISRVEALKVILKASSKFDVRVAAFQRKMPPIPLFSDIDQKQWYGPYVEAAFENGAITGYPDGTFRPDQLVRVEEAVTMLMRTFEAEGVKGKAELSSFIENKANQWYTPSINAAVKKNLLMHTGKLRLGTAISRGQFFDMVYRLHSMRAIGALVYEGHEPKAPEKSIAVPVQRSVPVATAGSNAGITTVSTNGNSAQSVGITPSEPKNVTVASSIRHPYASEKYFAISMPSIGIIDLTINHPADAASTKSVLDILKLGVGHLFAYPGGGGKIMVYGHSSGYPWDVSEYTKIFRKINELEPGDKVYVTYAGNLYVYEVTYEQTILASKADEAFRDNGDGEELILFTCWPPDSISERYLVHAVPVETVALR